MQLIKKLNSRLKRGHTFTLPWEKPALFVQPLLFSLTGLLLLLTSCINTKPKLQPVSHAQFKAFVKATNYITDAEKYGWSFVQLDVYRFNAVKGATWQKPDGANTPTPQSPVTQVSYNDALAYCRWSNSRLPNYEEYWQLIKKDKREVITNNNAPISVVDSVNILGNVWDITNTNKGDSIRLAGGSLYCSEHTCHGTSKDRKLYIDKITGNTHIGFAVISQKRKN